jgi:carbon starvation protein
MIDNEADIRPIGYGAMLVEGFVGMLALIAACTLIPEHYFAINADPTKFASSAETLGQLAQTAAQVGEKTLVGRTGGAVTLAVGMANIFKSLPGMSGLMSYWYHFAIMFEALFILTTIDAGTRVARFILQEMLGRAYKPFCHGTWWPGVLLTSFAVTYAWYYLLHGGTVGTIWPMFGIANQLLGTVALAIGTTYILRHAAKRVYALTTFAPFLFMAVTIFTSGVQFTSKVTSGPQPDWLKAILTLLMMALAAIICFECIRNWRRILCGTCEPLPEHEPVGDLLALAEGTEVAD